MSLSELSGCNGDGYASDSQRNTDLDMQQKGKQKKGKRCEKYMKTRGEEIGKEISWIDLP